MAVKVTQGSSPVILAQPHGGIEIQRVIASRLNDRGRELADTDWHITRLYEGLLDEATVVSAQFHRYVIDANRDPTGKSLYPGQNSTELCPTTDFDGEAIYQPGDTPSVNDIQSRRENYHQRYHHALAAEIDRVRAIHGIVVVYDCHSIRSHIPFLFDGELPVFNVGTNGGTSCMPEIEQRMVSECKAAHAAANEFTWVLNGRFKGGWTTRRYGKPDQGVHAIQLELAQRAYMTEASPWSYDDSRARNLRPILARMLRSINEAALSTK